MSNMIDLSNPNLNLADLNVVEYKRPQRKPKDRVFVPVCRIMPEYRDAFKHKEYKVSKLPKELYELFQQEASR